MNNIPGIPPPFQARFAAWLKAFINTNNEQEQDSIYTPADIRAMIPPYMKGQGQNQAGLVPTVSLIRSTSQAVPLSTWTSISWSSAKWNADNMWASGAPTLISFKSPGRYSFWCGIQFASSAVGLRYTRFFANGATIIGPTVSQTAVSGDATTITNYMEIEVGTSSTSEIQPFGTVAIQCFQSTAGDLNVLAWGGATKLANTYREA